MLPCRAVRNLFSLVRCGCRLVLLLFVFCTLSLFTRLPCAAQNPLPLTVGIANHQSSVTVPFAPEFTTSGYIPVEVRINGKGPYTFVIDTGAGASIIRQDIAVALGLPIIAKGRITTGSNAKAAAKIRTANTLQIGAAALNNVTLYAVDLPAEFSGEGILGADFLAQFIVTVDYEHQRVTLTIPDKFTYNGKATPLPFTFDEDGSPFIAASIEGIPGQFMLDSGSNAGMDLSQSFVQKRHLRDKFPRHIETLGGVELAGTPGTVWDARADTVILGEAPSVHNVIVSLTNSAYAGDGIIGSKVLRQFTLTVDWPHRRFYLEKNRLYGQKTAYNRAGFVPRPARDCFEIVFVMANSPAADAGLKVGDRLMEIAGQPAKNWTFLKLRELVHGEPGAKLPLIVERDGKTIALVLTLRDLL